MNEPCNDHVWAFLREVRAPTGPAPQHTKFRVFVCPCGVAKVFPRQNFDLTTPDFQDAFRGGMKALGYGIIEES